ncbi:MAG: SPOR domain-containing protein, partial [Rhodothermales bacterium]|nr:SPOR domain-containing protein [Rhodothermales bacterium]
VTIARVGRLFVYGDGVDVGGIGAEGQTQSLLMGVEGQFAEKLLDSLGTGPVQHLVQGIQPLSGFDGAFVALSARAADALALPARGGEVELRLDAAEWAFVQDRLQREAADDGAAAPVAAAGRPGGFTVQLASFSDEARAVAKADELRGAWVHPVTVEGRTVYRVCYGLFRTADAAAVGQAHLRARGLDGFVKTLEASPVRSEAAPVQPTRVQ